MKIDLMNKYHYANFAVPEHSESKDRIVKLNERNISGNFTGKESVVTTKGFWNIMQKINTFCADKEVVTSNAIALVLASVLRPIGILSLPGDKNREDKIYAAGHSISSGIIGFVFSSILMKPITDAFKDFKKTIMSIKEDNDFSKIPQKKQERIKEIFNVQKLADLAKDEKFDQVSRFYKFIPDTLIFGVIKAMLTISLIPLILKYGFGIEKHKKPTPEQIQNNNTQTPTIESFMEDRK